MNRAQRHHLKENELERLAAQARETMEARRREILAAVVAIVVLGGGALGYYGWQQRGEGRAHAALAEALTIEAARIGPPAAPGTVAPGPSFPTERERSQAALEKFKAVADQYPDSDAGIFARYKQATTQMLLGAPAEAATAYQDVMQRDGDGVYGQMAQLGLAEAHARSGQYDQAIDAFKKLSARTDGTLPVDGVLMQLARTYVQAGKPTEAQQTFNRIVQEFPESPFNAQAKQEGEALKKAST
ncbi:MAG: tetratricopeptide repeat protein [Acidobacteria bacterium]|nr:tetratricopeptide repeat protein [Acidobacteriota bacterium]